MLKAERRYEYRKTRLKKWGPLFLMMAPGLIYLLFNNYVPMMGRFIAFKKDNFSLG